MKLFIENGYYEVVYDHHSYPNLEFIRLDEICERTYVTLKNVITGEFFTFDEQKIIKISRKLSLIQNHVAKN